MLNGKNQTENHYALLPNKVKTDKGDCLYFL